VAQRADLASTAFSLLTGSEEATCLSRPSTALRYDLGDLALIADVERWPVASSSGFLTARLGPIQRLPRTPNAASASKALP